MSPGAVRLGIDIGGTFTDVVLLDGDGVVRSRKVLSTPDDYARGVVEGALGLLAEHGIDPAHVESVVHASTVASNTILEGRGARTALVTTRGFRDVLELRRLRIPVLYDVQYEKPAPLVPRALRFEVDERLGPRGEIWEPLDEESVVAVGRRLATEGVEALAIALLHSYADDRHERRVEELLRPFVGDHVFVTRSAELLPELREYERTSTAVVNAYVGPAVTGYIEELARRLRVAGLTAPLELVQSSGGTLDVESALRRPAHLVESGPAAGVVACARLGRLTGRPDLISLDMGGTTAKAALLEGGEPLRTSEYEVGAGINVSSKLVQGGGHPIRLPFVDVSEIGAGGGSLVTVDPLGTVSVGPRSAGAAPGPACYGLGGERPTLTDALLVLGWLNPTSLAGGSFALDADAAWRAITDHVADPLGLSPHDAAHGVLVLAVATMTRAVKAVTTYRGRDPRDYALCAFGGNGPLVGAEIARALGIRTVLVPHAPGVFSAAGLLFSDTEREAVRTLLLRGAAVAVEPIETALAGLERSVRATLAEHAGEITITRAAELRYAGQAYELPVPVPAGPVDVAALVASFVAEHVRTYGHGSPTDPVDVVAVRVSARIARAVDGGASIGAELGASTRLDGARRAWFGPASDPVDVPVRSRAHLLDEPLRGPLLIDEGDSTVVVPPGCTARVDEHGTVELEVGDAS